MKLMYVDQLRKSGISGAMGLCERFIRRRSAADGDGVCANCAATAPRAIIKLSAQTIVIGAGPASLIAAYELSKLGIDSTVFESGPVDCRNPRRATILGPAERL